jgi:hypothetical protein
MWTMWTMGSKSRGAQTCAMGAILIAGLAYTFITMVFLAIAIVIKNSV